MATSSALGPGVSATIRVMVVDDHPVVREGIVSQLKRCSEIEVVGQAGDGEHAVVECTRLHPDIVLLDVRLPDQLAPEVVPRLLRTSPHTKVLLFTAFPDHAAVRPSLAAGARGLLVKDSSAGELCAALRQVARGGPAEAGPGREDQSGPAPVVTPRQYDVLRLVACGHTNLEIGHELGLSVNTVKTYLGHVMQALQARNRAQLITNARARGLL